MHSGMHANSSGIQKPKEFLPHASERLLHGRTTVVVVVIFAPSGFLLMQQHAANDRISTASTGRRSVIISCQCEDCTHQSIWLRTAGWLAVWCWERRRGGEAVGEGERGVVVWKWASKKNDAHIYLSAHIFNYRTLTHSLTVSKQGRRTPPTCRPV